MQMKKMCLCQNGSANADDFLKYNLCQNDGANANEENVFV